MSKKAFQKKLLAHGIQSPYSGKTRTLYVKGVIPESERVLNAMVLDFKIVVQ